MVPEGCSSAIRCAARQERADHPDLEVRVSLDHRAEGDAWNGVEGMACSGGGGCTPTVIPACFLPEEYFI
ncbi:MAG: hypothetical protein U9N81_04295 [Bacillota bacterium]|nr:hypothetical protein [Bacillota bacterium]MEA1960501.1 hypothetical protein [Bacillota bacterium]